ncbi:hypothetical protein JCM8097_009355 [Rhodosporidiobolus ruineniae]
MPSQGLVFYDLVGAHGGAFWSPNTWKTRLSLLHKGVDFEEREVTYMDLKELASEIGVAQPTCPFIRLPSGEYMMDSWRIAEWLDKEYPDKPSLFLPDAPTPVDLSNPALLLARNYATAFTEGFGNSDSQWTTFLELSLPGIAASMPDLEPGVPNPNRVYFTSDEKLGMKDAWATFTSLDRPTLIERGKACLLPLDLILSSSQYLSGNHPGFVDYIVYGRYHMMRATCPADTEEVWLKPESLKHVAEWVKRIEKRWESELKDAMARLPKLEA